MKGEVWTRLTLLTLLTSIPLRTLQLRYRKCLTRSEVVHVLYVRSLLDER